MSFYRHFGFRKTFTYTHYLHRTRLLVWGILLLIAAALLLASAVHCEPILQPKPVARARFDSGWWTRSLALASAYDGATTRYGEGQHQYSQEANPVSRVFLGAHPAAPRLALMGALETVGVGFIPNKKVRRIVQVGLIGAHIALGTKNLKGGV